MKQNLPIQFAAALLVLVIASSCTTAKARTPASKAEYKDHDQSNDRSVGGVNDKTGGVIRGVVLYTGFKPKRRPINMGAKALCNAAWNGKVPLYEGWVFGKTKDEKDTLANVLVYISKGFEGRKFPVPKDSVIMDTERCIYNPHVVALRTGQPFQWINRIDHTHSPNFLSKKQPPFGIAHLPRAGKSWKRKFKAEIGVRMRCSVHPWMVAYIHILDHPFFAITGKNGSFELRGLPPGEYEVTVYHEQTRIFEAKPAKIQVKIEAEQTKQLTFTYSPKKKKKIEPQGK